jgi:hypothetical protein
MTEKVIKALGLNDTPCAIPGDYCVLEPDVKKYLKEFIVFKGKKIPENASVSDIYNLAYETLGIEKDKKNEAAIWENSEVRKFIGREKSQAILNKYFKPIGPNNSTALLDNRNIDNVLKQWSENSVILFACKFKHIPFQMIDFMAQGTELASLDIPQLMKDGYDCFGVVLNTDVSSGGGKHWFCIFGELTDRLNKKKLGTQDKPIQIEYFNSSGNPPMLEVDLWLEKTKHDLRKNPIGLYVNIVRAFDTRLQQSQTECGVWSLMYIKYRLDSKPIKLFLQKKIDDDDMIECRKLIFRDATAV